jgi:hypothetical protein
MRLRQTADIQYRYTRPGGGRGTITTAVPPQGATWKARRIRIDYHVTLTSAGGVYVQPAHRKQSMTRLDKTFTTVEAVEAELANRGYTDMERTK